MLNVGRLQASTTPPGLSRALVHCVVRRGSLLHRKPARALTIATIIPIPARIIDSMLTTPPRTLGDMATTTPITPKTKATIARRKPAPGETKKLAIAAAIAIKDGILKCAFVCTDCVSMEKRRPGLRQQH